MHTISYTHLSIFRGGSGQRKKRNGRARIECGIACGMNHDTALGDRLFQFDTCSVSISLGQRLASSRASTWTWMVSLPNTAHVNAMAWHLSSKHAPFSVPLSTFFQYLYLLLLRKGINVVTIQDIQPLLSRRVTLFFFRFSADGSTKRMLI